MIVAVAPKDTRWEIFLAAREATRRLCAERWAKEAGASKNNGSKSNGDLEAAKNQFYRLPILADPQLAALAREVVTASLGEYVSEDTVLPHTIWFEGATSSKDGHPFEGTFGNFIEILEKRAQVIAAKMHGWVMTPTSNSDGRRCNASTTAMHALNLDCDGRGTWEPLLAALQQIGLAYAAYQSGGWTAETPKWHVLIPLAEPFNTWTPQKIYEWKEIYNHARVIFGALAQLLGEGFDPTIETPSQPVFLCERRSKDDPPRQVAWSYGRSLDLDAFARLLPPVAVQASVDASRTAIEPGEPLEDDRLESLTAALCVPMSMILSGRRELYMALPGAMLDRGICPEDVLAIGTEISLRCPGDRSNTPGDVTKKHREHIHAIETTIAKFLAGEPHTQIGTLNANWPDVALALDAVMPDPRLEEIRAKIAEIDARRSRMSVMMSSVTMSKQTRTTSQTVDLVALRKRLVALRRRKLGAGRLQEKIRGAIIDALLKGEDLTPCIVTTKPSGDGTVVTVTEFLRDDDDRIIDRDASITLAMKLVAFKLPAGTPFEAVKEIVRPSLFAMVKTAETEREKAERAGVKKMPLTLEMLFAKAERVFVTTAEKKIDADRKREKAAQVRRFDRTAS